MKYTITFTNIFLAIIPLLLLPFVRKVFDQDFYNLFSLIFVVQSVIMICELGLNTVLVKLIGDFHSGETSLSQLQQFVTFVTKYLLLILLVITVIAFSGINIFAEYSSSLDSKVFYILLLLGVSRFAVSVPRIILYGFEIYLKTSILVVTASLFRYLVPIIIKISVDLADENFLGICLLFSLLEGLLLLRLVKLNCLDRIFVNVIKVNVRNYHILLRKYWKTGVYSFLPGILWIFTTNIDRMLYVETTNNLGDLGSLVAISGLASGLLLLVNSFNAAHMPTLVKLGHSRSDLRAEFGKYFTQGLIVILCPVLFLFSFADFVLLAWFRDESIAQRYTIILGYYVLMYGVIALNTLFITYLFCANNLNVHFITSCVFTMLLILNYAFTKDFELFLLRSIFASLIVVFLNALFIVKLIAKNV